MIYVNINSPIERSGSHLSYTAYELDVVSRPSQPTKIVDEEEFAEAASRCNYPASFQQYCYGAARKGLELAENWVARGAPDVA